MGQAANPINGTDGQDAKYISNISYDQTNQKFVTTFSDGSTSSFNYSVDTKANKGPPGTDLQSIAINGNTITSTFKDGTTSSGTIDTSSIDTTQIKNFTLWCEQNTCNLPDSSYQLTTTSNSNINVGYFNPSSLTSNAFISTQGQTNGVDNGFYASYGDNSGYLYQNSLTDKGLQLKNGSIYMINNLGEGPYQVKSNQGGLCLDANALNNKSNNVFATCDDSNYNQWWYYNNTNGKLYNDNIKKCMTNNGDTNGTWGMETCNDSNGNQYFTRTASSELQSGTGHCLSSVGGSTNTLACANQAGGIPNNTKLNFVPRFSFFGGGGSTTASQITAGQSINNTVQNIANAFTIKK